MDFTSVLFEGKKTAITERFDQPVTFEQFADGDALTEIIQKRGNSRIVIVTGKGGVGKSSFTANLAQALAAGAEDVALVATEPLRRADDRVEVLRRISSHVEGRIAVLEHAEEGLLTVLGLRHGHDRSRLVPPSTVAELVDVEVGAERREVHRRPQPEELRK